MFNNIIGNEECKRALKNIIYNNSVSHSYIFSGIAGIGKFMFAKEFAKALICLNKEEKPCDKCKACESFNNLNNPDIVIIDEQENSIKTEQIKELVNNIFEKPIQGNKKIYIINNSENMTKEAQNSLLKTLEEPPEYVIIILVTSNENVLLNTIKSRCIKIAFHMLSETEVKEYFKSIGQEVNGSIINSFGGSIEKAIKINNKKDIYGKIYNAFQNIQDLNELQIFALKDIFTQDKDEIFSILEYINEIFLDKLLKDLSNANKYQKCINSIEETKMRLKRNSNFDMTIDNCLFLLERSLN